jgi:hypothetical protein
MSYLFIYKYSSKTLSCVSENAACFNYNVLDDVTQDYQYYQGKRHYRAMLDEDAHIIHKIAQAVNDQVMVYAGILELKDDYEAVAFKMQHDEFFNINATKSTYQKIVLDGVYANIDFETLLADCPLVSEYVSRATTRRTDSKFVTKTASAIWDISRSIEGLNGALGEDFEEQVLAIGQLANQRIEEYRANVKKTASKLAKERATIRKRMAQFLAKE